MRAGLRLRLSRMLASLLLRCLLTRARCGLGSRLNSLTGLRLMRADFGLMGLRLTGLRLASLRLPHRRLTGFGLPCGSLARCLLRTRVRLSLSGLLSPHRGLLASLDAGVIVACALLRLGAGRLLMLARCHGLALLVLALQRLLMRLSGPLLASPFGRLLTLALRGDLLRLLPLLRGARLDLASAIGLVAALLLRMLYDLTLAFGLLALLVGTLLLGVPRLRDLLLAALLLGALAGGGETLLLGSALGAGASIEIGRRATLARAAPIGVAHGRLLAFPLFGAPMRGLLLDRTAAGGVTAPIVAAGMLDRIAAMIPLPRRHAAMALLS